MRHKGKKPHWDLPCRVSTVFTEKATHKDKASEGEEQITGFLTRPVCTCHSELWHHGSDRLTRITSKGHQQNRLGCSRQGKWDELDGVSCPVQASFCYSDRSLFNLLLKTSIEDFSCFLSYEPTSLHWEGANLGFWPALHPFHSQLSPLFLVLSPEPSRKISLFFSTAILHMFKVFCLSSGISRLNSSHSFILSS